MIEYDLGRTQAGKTVRTIDLYPPVSVHISGFCKGFCRSSAGPNHVVKKNLCPSSSSSSSSSSLVTRMIDFLEGDL